MLADRLTCHYHPRAAGTLVLDPAEAAPEPGLRPDPLVRVYDTGAGPAMAWMIYPRRELQPEPDHRKAAAALRIYRRREELLAGWLHQQKTRHVREANKRRAQERIAAEQERAWRRREEENRRQAAALQEQAERLRRAAVEQAEREQRLRLEAAETAAAANRHVDASGSPDRFQAYRFTEGIVNRPALFDPAASDGSDGVFYLFVPSLGKDAIRRVAGSAHPRGHPHCTPDPDVASLPKLLVSYREWRDDQLELRRIAGLIQDYHLAGESARSRFGAAVDDSVELFEISLNGDDCRLVLGWCDRLHNGIREQIVRILRDPESRRFLYQPVETRGRGRGRRPLAVAVLEQMLSARMAEHAVRILYERHDPALRAPGSTIIDMSIRQVSGERPFDKTFDLAYPKPVKARRHQAGRVLLDVKNTRADPQDPDGYNRLYAKRIRPALPDGSHVRIVGTVSKFDHCGSLVDRPFGGGRIRILGEATRAQIAALEERYSLPSLKLSLAYTAGDDGVLMPPWIFQAPDFFVAARRQAAARLRRAYRRHPRPEERAALPLPLSIASGIPVPAQQRRALTAAQDSFVNRLEAMPLRLRWSLPDLYLTILQEFVALLPGSREEQAAYDPEQYRDVLYLAGNQEAPLGLHDPLRSVSHLLASLGYLRRYGWDRLSEFKFLEFRHAGVLYAQKAERGLSWTLMFTHCGNVFECGGRRLVLGRESLCSHCRRLMCQRCHFCSRGCPYNGVAPHRRPRSDADERR